MPIRINLLAEQQAAEEARRRDPVKRAALYASLAVVAVLLWSGNLQFKISGLKSEVSALDGRFKQIESNFLQVSNNNKESGLIRKKLESLQHYTTNRFAWASALNALQFVADDGVRAINFSGLSVFKEEKAALVSTNITVALPPKQWWKLWSSPFQTNLDPSIKTMIGSITTNFGRFQSHLIVGTNVSQTPLQIQARIEVTKPETISERPTLTVKARDYSNPPGQSVDKFHGTLTNHPYFKAFVLGRTNSSVQPDAIQFQQDPSDLISPTDSFIPFTVEFRFPERIRSNE
jgi:hypothetical protein